MVAIEALTKIRKILTRKMIYLPFNKIFTLLELSSNKKDLLFTEVSSIQKIEAFMLDNYNILELGEKVI